MLNAMSDKRKQLIEASIDLFAREGFWNTPTSRITKHAKVSTGTLFNYFASKNALIDAVFLQLKEEQAAYIADNFPPQTAVQTCFEHIWFRYIEWGLHNPVRYTLLQQLKLSNMVSDEAQARQDGSLGFAFDLVAAAVNAGVFRSISADYLIYIALAQLDASVTYAATHKLTDMALSKHITRGFEVFWLGVTG